MLVYYGWVDLGSDPKQLYDLLKKALKQTPASSAAKSINGEVFRDMRGRHLRGDEIAAFKARAKSRYRLGLCLFAQVVSRDHLLGVLDQVLHDPLVAVVGQQRPIDLRLAVPLEERGAVLAGGVGRLSDEDEVSLPGRQHHVIPIDDEYVAGPVTQQIARVQVGMTDDVWPHL